MGPVLISPFLQPLAFVHVMNHSLLTWDSPFDARGANVRPHLSLVGEVSPTINGDQFTKPPINAKTAPILST